MIDIDYFKQINDEHGREFAEGVLCRVAQRLTKASEGKFDWIPARYGGDEFVFWLGGSDAEQAAKVAQKIQQDVARMQVPILSQPGEVFRFTVSVGITSSTSDDDVSLDTLLARAADDVHHQRNKRRFKQRSQKTGIRAAKALPEKDFNTQAETVFNTESDRAVVKGRGYSDD